MNVLSEVPPKAVAERALFPVSPMIEWGPG